MMDGGESKQGGDSDLSSLIDKTILIDKSSEKLREFYKKLVQTDAMIKNLKNEKFHNQNNMFNDNYENREPDRFKRSLKVYHYPRRRQARRKRRDNLYRTNDLANEPIKNKSRLKRFGNETGDPTAFVIEKKKLIVQYKPLYLKKLVPKCSHVPKEHQAHHEHQLKHPFYQNTQRLDELLDRFLNKNLPEIVSDPFGLDALFQREKNKCKHPIPTKNVDIVNIDLKGEEVRVKQNKMQNKAFKGKSAHNNMLTSTLHYELSSPTIASVQRAKIKNKQDKKVVSKNTKSPEDLLKEKKKLFTYSTPDILKLLDHELSTPFERKFYIHEAEMINKEDVTLVTASPSDFELLLSVSTLMNPEVVEETAPLSSSEIPLINRVPNIRRLLQVDGEEEENLGYEDFKEVLTDNMENQDDIEGRGERKKRDYDAEDEVTEISFTKLGIKLNEPMEGKDPMSEVTVAGDWSSVMDDATPQTFIKDVYQKENKLNLPSNNVNNPNWKGPMPLYPDELSSMLKEKSLDISKENILSTESRRMETKPPLEKSKRKRSDIEYVEDYLDDKYDRLVEMAQAYSDYGVLEDKKENIRNDKHPATNNKLSGDRVKMSADGTFRGGDIVAIDKDTGAVFYPFCIHSKDKTSTTGLSSGIFRILADDQTSTTVVTKPTSEGFRVEIRPSQTRKDSLVSKLIQSHIKLDAPEKKIEEVTKTKYTPVSIFPKTQLLYSPKFKINSLEEVLNKKMPSRDEMPNTIFSNIKKRSLLSTLFKGSDYDILQNKEKPLDYNISDDDQNINIIELDDTNIIENSKTDNKRANEISNANAFRKLFKEKNLFLKNLVSKYIHNGDYSNSDRDMVLLNLDRQGSTPSTQANIMNDVSQLTKNYVWLFSTPYLYSQSKEEQITLSPMKNIAESRLRLLELNSNNTSNSEHRHEILDQLKKLNSSDVAVSMEDTRFKPITIDLNNFQKQMYMTLKHPIVKENAKAEFEMPYLINYSDLTDGHYKFDELNTVTPSMIPETSPNVVDAFQLVKRIKRFKRNVGTAKAMLEKSNVTINESPLGLTEVNKHTSVNDTQGIANSSVSENFNSKHNITTNNITISDFFMMISNWFKMLEGIKVHQNKSRLNPGCDLPELLLQLNTKANKSKYENRSSTTDSVYPFYDSEIIDNIGHRSRVLLSIQEENTTESARRISIDDNKEVIEEKANVTGTENNTSAATATITQYISVNKSTQEDQIHTDTTSDVPKRDNNTSNKVKRNADDSNLISWNDIYDDEYGIQTDNFNNVRDKYSKERDFIKRSGRWVQDKFKKIAQNLKARIPEKVVKRSTLGTVENVGLVKKLKDLYRKSKRQSDEEEYDTNQKTVFNTLENNMIAVCRKAANAVKQTRNAETKEETSQGTLAATLMQQLVRLLTDLVDYQVEQKTCCQLPPDLKVFLEWLTKPEEEQKEERVASSLTNEKPEYLISKISTPTYSRVDTIDELTKEKPMEYTTSTENVPIGFKESDLRTQYLETIHSLQELLDRYEEMSDEEKSKMTGVKFYLQNQLHRLHNQISGFDLYNLYEKSSIPIRYKRGLQPRSIKSRRKRKHYKFVRNFGKKHTRTTASYYDGIPIPEKKKKKKNLESRNEKQHGRKRFKMTVPKRNERNLKDIYYKAVAEAKKYSTALAKNGHNKHQEVDYTGTTRVEK
ncbi:unnamed protein product [Arctia plantaginis]|uniref:Uncharacterized protein n=1 Tax=Arctia plantaginis TaxID=874455 RepID=A0A8S0ZTB9_ARCPL|nr:unnamed protein product [Arctia plantaginis]